MVDSYPKNNHLNDSGLIGDFLKKREGKWGHVSCVLTGSDKDLGCSMLTLSVSVGLLLSQQELELMQCPNIEDKIVVVRKKKKKSCSCFCSNKLVCLLVSTVILESTILHKDYMFFILLQNDLITNYMSYLISYLIKE